MLIRANLSPFPRRVAQNFQLSILIIALGLVIAITLLTHHSEENSVPKPTVEIVNETEIIWEIPNNPKAVLFMAHGCGGTPRNFWARCPTCPECVGLPEESYIVLDALAQRYAVLVVSSSRRCWTYRNERKRVARIIKWWLEKNALVNVPLLGLGASSGGTFLSILAEKVRFRGIVLMVASGLYDQMKNIPSSYPPTLFVHMPKDARQARKVYVNMIILRKAGVQVEEIKCMEFPITPSWLGNRIIGLNQTTSSKIFDALHDQGYIDDNGYLKKDGRVIPWRKALKRRNITLSFDDSLLMEHIHKYIEEELNVAYGYHEMTSFQSKEIFEWFDSHIK